MTTHVDTLIDFSLADLSRADFYPPSRYRVSRWFKEMPAKMTTLLIMCDIYHKRVKEGGDLPQVNIPLACLPQVSLPQVSLPQVSLPQVSLPQVSLPQVSLPQVNLPQVNLPMIGLPLTLVAVAAVVPTVWLAGSSDGNTQLAPQVLPVETMALESEDSYEVSRAYSGEIVARRSSDLGFELAGTVTDLLVEEGDTVTAGAPLAALDTRDLLAQRQQLEAQKRQLQAQLQELEVGARQEDIAAARAAVSDLSNQLELARLQYSRRAALYEQGAISREELDERLFGANAIADRLQQAQSQLEELLNGTRPEQVEAQQAQVDQIDARIDAINISLDKSVLYAPFSGTIAERTIDEGTVVGNGQRVVRLVESGILEARIGVPEEISQQLTVGSQQSVTVGRGNYPATVVARLPEVDEASQTVTMVLELNDPSFVNAKSIGATARLQVSERQVEEGYWLPNTALVGGDRGLWSVYVLSKQPDNVEAFHVARRDVEVLYSEGDRAFVRGLVQSGDVAIVNGTHRVVPGQLVKPEKLFSTGGS